MKLNEAQRFELADWLMSLFHNGTIAREEAERRMRQSGFGANEIRKIFEGKAP